MNSRIVKSILPAATVTWSLYCMTILRLVKEVIEMEAMIVCTDGGDWYGGKAGK